MNKDLKTIYDNIYKNGEYNYYTNDHAEDEVISSISWHDKKVLDVGCGTGKFVHLSTVFGADVLGIDYSQKAIDIAKDKYPELKFEHKDMKDITGKYDVIVSLGTLEHTDNPLDILRLFKEHLNKDGKIILTCPYWNNPRGYILQTLLHLFDSKITLADIHYLSEKDFMRWSKDLGMNLHWETFDISWGCGDKMIKDLEKRLPKVLPDVSSHNIYSLIKWLKDNHTNCNGATGLYVMSNDNI